MVAPLTMRIYDLSKNSQDIPKLYFNNLIRKALFFDAYIEKSTFFLLHNAEMYFSRYNGLNNFFDETIFKLIVISASESRDGIKNSIGST